MSPRRSSVPDPQTQKDDSDTPSGLSVDHLSEPHRSYQGDESLGLGMEVTDDFDFNREFLQSLFGEVESWSDVLSAADRTNTNGGFDFDPYIDNPRSGIDDCGVSGVPRNSDNSAADHVEPTNPSDEYQWEDLYMVDWIEEILVDNVERDIELGLLSEQIVDAFDAESENFFQQLDDNDVDLIGNRPTAKEVVKNLPLVELKEEDLSGGVGMVCAVCGDDFREGEMVNRLHCCHYYHGRCIMPWLRIRNTCPLCRYELPTDDRG